MWFQYDFFLIFEFTIFIILISFLLLLFAFLVIKIKCNDITFSFKKLTIIYISFLFLSFLSWIWIIPIILLISSALSSCFVYIGNKLIFTKNSCTFIELFFYIFYLVNLFIGHFFIFTIVSHF